MIAHGSRRHAATAPLLLFLVLRVTPNLGGCFALQHPLPLICCHAAAERAEGKSSLWWQRQREAQQRSPRPHCHAFHRQPLCAAATAPTDYYDNREVDDVLSSFDVTRDRGFLLPHTDPLVSLPTCLEDADVCELLEKWDALIHELSSLCAAGAVRRVIDDTLSVSSSRTTITIPPIAIENDNDETRSENVYVRAVEFLQSLEDDGVAAAALERANLILSFLAHAYIWCDDEQHDHNGNDEDDSDNKDAHVRVLSVLPAHLAQPWCLVAHALGRPPILTYYSYNACNWRRISRGGRADSSSMLELGNLCRLANFFGGQDEEWFSMVHVAIEAKAGRALFACARAHKAVQQNDASIVAFSLKELEATLLEQVAILNRMEEKSDPYVYNLRVRVPMSGWTDDRIDPRGMAYEGVVVAARDATNATILTGSSTGEPSNNGHDDWRRERYFGETGAQSSYIPAVDAALGLSCDASCSRNSESSQVMDHHDDTARAQALIPYLLAMREYMPPRHAALISAFAEEGPRLKDYVIAASSLSSNDDDEERHELAAQFDRCVAVLADFRRLHLGLAQRFVRQWDKRNDDEVIGTGGTAFMPYLRAHREATQRHAIGDLD